MCAPRPDRHAESQVLQHEVAFPVPTRVRSLAE